MKFPATMNRSACLTRSREHVASITKKQIEQPAHARRSRRGRRVIVELSKLVAIITKSGLKCNKKTERQIHEA